MDARCRGSHIALVWGVLVLAAGSRARAAEQPAVERSVVVGPARLTLAIDRAEFFLGENVLIDYCLENLGAEPLWIDVGSDNEFVSRNLRFHLVVTAADGSAVAAPDDASSSGGGIGWRFSLAHGESYCQSLPLLRYARIDAPGEYTVRVTHDLGWAKAGGLKAPTGELPVRFLMPDASEAARLVDEVLALPSESSTGPPRRDTPWGDPTTLRYPVYLAPLLARAEAGEPRAVIALGEVPSPQATQALLKLARSPAREVARTAVSALTSRLPDLEFTGPLPARDPFVSSQLANLRCLNRAVWRGEQVPDARQLARELLAASEPSQVAAGALILECVGAAEDLAPVSAALAVAINHPQSEKGIYPRPHGAAQELVRAATMLLARGAVLPPVPRSVGEWGVFFVQARRGPAFLAAVTPDVWQVTLGSPFSYLRQLALESITGEPPPAVHALLPHLLSDPDLDVSIEACRVASHSRDPSLVPALMTILRTASDFMLLNGALNAASALGAYYDALLTAAERLPEKDQFGTMMGFLAGLVEGSRGYSSDSHQTAQDLAATRRLWQRFLSEHREEIAAGQHFTVGDPRLPRALFPPGFHFWTVDGHQWP